MQVAAARNREIDLVENPIPLKKWEEFLKNRRMKKHSPPPYVTNDEEQ